MKNKKTPQDSWRILSEAEREKYSVLFQLQTRNFMNEQALIEEKDLGEAPLHSAAFKALDFTQLSIPGGFKKLHRKGQPLVPKKTGIQEELHVYVEEHHEALWALFPGSSPQEVYEVLTEMYDLTFQVMDELKQLT